MFQTSDTVYPPDNIEQESENSN